MTGLETLTVRLRDLFTARATLDVGMPLDRIPFAVLDTELTGLDPKRDSVVSLGIVKMWGTRIEMGRTYYRLLRPATAMGREGILVHGITPGEVAGEPTIGEVAGELKAFCGDRILAGHFLSIDLTFLARGIAGFDAVEEQRRAVDTRSLHRWMEQHRHRHGGAYTVPEGEMNLFTLAQRDGITVHGAHNALQDAFITAQLLQRRLHRLPDLGVRTLGDLLRVGRP